MTQSVKEQFHRPSVIPEFTIPKGDEAYIRIDRLNGETVWTIFDSDGDNIGYASSREVAMAVAYQNDLIPYNVH